MATKKNLKIYEEEFIKLYNEGKSMRAIAEIYKVSKTSVRSVLKDKIEQRPKSSVKESDYEEICNEYLGGSSVNALKKKYKTSNITIINILKESGINIEIQKKYEKLVDNFKEDYKNGLSLSDISIKYNVSRQTVLTYLNQEEEKIRTYVEAGNKIYCDETYFDDLTNEKAYELGQLISFTTITKSKSGNNFLNIKTKVSDKERLLSLISKFSDKTIDNMEYTSRNGKVTTASIRIFNEYLINKLEAYGLGTRHYNIPEDKRRSFYEGLLRQEGNVWLEKFGISANKIDIDELFSVWDLKECEIRVQYVMLKSRSESSNKEYLSHYCIQGKDDKIKLCIKSPCLRKKAEEYMLNNPEKNLTQWDKVFKEII